VKATSRVNPLGCTSSSCWLGWTSNWVCAHFAGDAGVDSFGFCADA